MKSNLILAGLIGIACFVLPCHAARYEQLSITELTVADIIFGDVKITASAAELNSLDGAALAGAQAASQTNNSTLAVTDSLVNISGTTNAASIIVNLTLPTPAQVGQLVYIRNISTQVVNLVYATATTNSLGVTGTSTNAQLYLAAATNEWFPLSIPVVGSALQKLALNNFGDGTNINAAGIKVGSVAPAFDVNAATNFNAANIKVGGVFPVSDGKNFTNITATVTLSTITGYDATGAAITNAAGTVVAIVTNVTVAINP